VTTSLDIKTIVDLIASSEHRRAVEVWEGLCSDKGKCDPCFYAPLKETIRCASCLESHLSYALLQRLYAHVEEAEITLAQQNLRGWLAAS